MVLMFLFPQNHLPKISFQKSIHVFKERLDRLGTSFACVSYVGNLSYIFNADVNGALNILRKSNVVDLEVLYSRGEVDTPVRIRIA